MNTTRLHAILRDCTMQLRKGDVVHGDKPLVDAINAGQTENLPGGVVTIDAMPHTDEVSGIEKVDCHFLVIGVDKAKAETHRLELISILNNYPKPARLAGGPSYIEIGAEIGDQGAAFQLFALGQVLGFWTVITPETLGMTGQEADSLAGKGLIMISGYNPYN